MGFGSIWHWLLVLLVLVLLFGAGKISGLMGDVAKGIKSFRKEMSEGEAEPEPEPRQAIEHKQELPPARQRKAKSASAAKAPAKQARARKSS